MDGVAFHVLVPFEGPDGVAFLVEREFRGLAVQEDHVVIAAGATVAAPFRARITDELAVLVEAVDQFDGFIPTLPGNLEIVGGVAEDVIRSPLALHRLVFRYMRSCT